MIPKYQLLRTIFFDHGREAIKGAKLEESHSATELQRVQSSKEMSNNRHKTIMCHVCGKVMRDDNLKRHLELKHGGSDIESRQSHPTNTSTDSLDHTSQDDGEPVEKNEAKTPMDMLELSETMMRTKRMSRWAS